MFQLQKRFLVLWWFFLTPLAYSAEPKAVKLNSSSVDKRPLVLQWEVSHPRNTDQISLIFREKTVELVTNTDSYQKGKVARLGRFESSLTVELKDLKDQVGRYYARLKKTVPLSSLIKDPRVQASVDPHAPVLRISEEEIQRGNAYFNPLASIIYKVWEREWTCVECATYKKTRKSIVRTVKKLKPNLNKKADERKASGKPSKNQWEERKQSFSKKLLNCIPKGKKKVECIDPRFGIFEI